MFEHKPTIKQIQANRLNAQKSTGPTSLEGKAAVAMNALKSGIHAEFQVIPGENATDLQALADEYHARFHPSTPEQRLLVDNLVHYEWLLRRFRTIEAHLVGNYMEIDPHTQYRYPLSHVYDHAYQQFGRLQWRINPVDRLYHHTLAALQRLQADHPQSSPPDPQTPRTADSGTSAEIGFVPQPGIGRRHALPPHPSIPPPPPPRLPSPSATPPAPYAGSASRTCPHPPIPSPPPPPPKISLDSNCNLL